MTFKMSNTRVINTETNLINRHSSTKNYFMKIEGKKKNATKPWCMNRISFSISQSAEE